MKALDFAIEHEVHGMKLKTLLDCVEQCKSRGDDKKATMMIRRLSELKRFDELKLKQNNQYKPLLVEWLISN